MSRDCMEGSTGVVARHSYIARCNWFQGRFWVGRYQVGNSQSCADPIQRATCIKADDEFCKGFPWGNYPLGTAPIGSFLVVGYSISWPLRIAQRML